MVFAPARSESTGARGALLPLSRAGVVILLVLAAANGLFLYLLPSQARVHYAWAITPPISAAFLGAGFLAGTVPTAIVVFATERWRSLRTLPWALFVLAVTLLIATIVHNDRFKWTYPPTWGWAAVYALVPFGVVYLWWRQERVAEPEPEADPSLRGLRVVSGVLGALIVLGALALFLTPVGLGKHWPWTLTPLLGRAVSPWYAMIGVILLACAVSLRTWTEALIPYATIFAWSVLVALLPVLHSGDVIRHGPEVAFYVVMFALLAVSLVALVRCWPAVRRL
jgi:hypothetical protein